MGRWVGAPTMKEIKSIFHDIHLRRIRVRYFRRRRNSLNRENILTVVSCQAAKDLARELSLSGLFGILSPGGSDMYRVPKRKAAVSCSSMYIYDLSQLFSQSKQLLQDNRHRGQR